LDTNANQACDTGEPSATTAKDGSYKLDTSSLVGVQLKNVHLLTVVTDKAKDADDGGKTLEEAGKKGFTFMAPVAAYETGSGSAAITGAVISPLTTLVSHDIITSQTTLATAQSNVRSRLGMAANADLTQDFVAKNDVALREKAQMLTVALGNVKAEALQVEGTTDKQALLAAVQYLQTQFTQLKAEFDAAKKEKPDAKPVDLVKTALAKDAAKPDTTSLLAEAKKITVSSAVGQISSLLEAGLYGAENVLSCSSAQNCAPHYYKVHGSGGKLTLDNSYDYDVAANTWIKDNSTERSSLRLTDKGWQTDSCANATYAEDGPGAVLVTCAAGAVDRVTARKVDAAGQTLSALGLNPPKGFGDIKMPAGAELYWLTFAAAADEYALYVSENDKVGKWDSVNSLPLTSLTALITRYTNVITSHSGLRFKFNTGGTETGGTVTLYNYNYSNWSDSTPTGTATYFIKTMGGQKALVINKAGPQNSDGSYVMFGEKDGFVYYGSFRNAAVVSKPEASFNKTMMNAILKAGDKPAVLN
jgi:hypothetical protein